ncbi:MAG TPA: four helix bundle protein [Prolixibacteraceae bacterium]|jgi:four helix bundle protein
MKTYTELFVWQKSMELVTNIYKDTKSFPKEEIYGLTSQIRRCSVSIPSNIAEGFGRKSEPEFIRFLKISMGSLFELQTQLRISKNIEYLNESRFNVLYEETREVERMLSSFILSIQPIPNK